MTQKEKNAAAQRKWRNANKGLVAERKRAYYLANKEAVDARNRAYASTHREETNRRIGRYIKEHPVQRNARARVKSAVARGCLIKPTVCPICGNEFPITEIQGHHKDYSKPLEVDWCCRQCHRSVYHTRQDVA